MKAVTHTTPRFSPSRTPVVLFIFRPLYVRPYFRNASPDFNAEPRAMLHHPRVTKAKRDHTHIRIKPRRDDVRVMPGIILLISFSRESAFACTTP